MSDYNRLNDKCIDLKSEIDRFGNTDVNSNSKEILLKIAKIAGQIKTSKTNKMKTPVLDVQTLTKKRGKYAPIWFTVFDLGLEGIVDPSKAPLIGAVGSIDGERIGGRYFPNKNAVLIYHNNDHFISLATAVHELAHFQMYLCKCGHVPRSASQRTKCLYKGEHDKDFYQVLEPMYKQAQVPTYAARAVEGKYDYPKHWNEDSWQ